MAIAVKNLRWWIVALLAAATALNYLDRQSFPVVAEEIRRVIPFSTVQYGRLTSIFLLAYAIMYAGGGWVLDRLGTRVGYATMIAWWSAANFLTGMVSSVLGLGVCRFLLGMGDGGGFPGSSKAVAEWFRPVPSAGCFLGYWSAGWSRRVATVRRLRPRGSWSRWLWSSSWPASDGSGRFCRSSRPEARFHFARETLHDRQSAN